MQTVHGIAFAEGSWATNLRVENISDIDGVPDNISTTGRIWFNVNLQKLQYTYNIGQILNVATIKTEKGGWKDLTAPFDIAKTGTSVAPVWADMGNGFYAWRFDNAKNTGLQVQYHTTHDIDYTKMAYQHIHWAPSSASIGNVYFKFEYLICKGHKQNDNLMSIVNKFVKYIVAPTDGLAGEHIVTEFQDPDGLNLIEPDCIILLNVSRQGTHALDTYAGSIYGFTADIHYWSEEETTPGRNPSFSVGDLPTSI